MVDIALGCPLHYVDRIIKESKGSEKAYHIEYGFRRIKLAGYNRELYLLVIRGFGETPLMLLTTIELRKKRSVLWDILESYITRWRMEETIRFIKQSYALEAYQGINLWPDKEHDGPGAGIGIFCARGIGIKVEIRDFGNACIKDGKTDIWHTGLSLLCAGGWNRKDFK